MVSEELCQLLDSRTLSALLYALPNHVPRGALTP